MHSMHALREACCEANRRLPALGLVDLTFGNVSVADRTAGCFAIKPSGVGYDDLRPSDIVVLDFDGNVLQGNLRPSSDTATHALLLRSFEGVDCVVHTHSRHATSWAQACRALPCLGTTHADSFNGDVPVTRQLTPAEVQEAYELNTGRVIVETFARRSPLEIPAVLVAGHGPFAWGPTWEKALENAFVLEVVAQMALATLALNPSSHGLPAHILNKHYTRKHGPKATYGQAGC
jgi:L-ribulose-5-phosphate 4-epimerase